MSKEIPQTAQVVIVGGGVIGCSVAYHLAQAGWQDVVLLEQEQLTSGTTWHAAGLVGQLRSTRNHSELGVYSTHLYETLEQETGLATGWKRCGSFLLATTNARMSALKRSADMAQAFGIDCDLVSQTEVAQDWPLLRSDDVLGALWLPGDGKANPTDLTQSLAKGARQRGTRIIEGVRVHGVHTGNGRVVGLDTSAGPINTDIVVNCAGQWARQLGALAGVDVPLHSAEHFYMVTGEIEGVYPDLPVLRDPDGYIYFKEEVGGLVMGGFEPEAKPWASNGVPDDFAFQLLPEDWDHFNLLLENAMHRVPALETADIKLSVNGPESFTPDGRFIVGEAPWLKNFYVCAGFNSSGIASAGGAGKLMADWLDGGEAPMDVSDVDIRRFAAFHNAPAFLRERTVESLGLHYAQHWPRMELESARPLRQSPLYTRLSKCGAVFGSKMGWERPNWFAPAGTPEPRYTFDRPGWLGLCLEEQRATREAVTLFDETSFSKLMVSGADAENLLQRLCANDVSGPLGTVTYTGMLNERGGYESDVTVSRLSEGRFLVVSGSAQTTRDHARLSRHASGFNCDVVDVSSSYAVIAVMGPRARELLCRVSEDDFATEKFPFGTAASISIGPARVWALRVSYVGELGWELYVSTEFAAGVFDRLSESGADLGVANGGYYAIDAMRIEKGYRAWGAELTADDTPVEAGLSFAIKPDKGVDFIGRDAVLQQLECGTCRRIVQFGVSDPEVMLWGGEPILRDGRRVGELTSAGVGYATDATVAMGYVNSPERLRGRKVWSEYVDAGRFTILIAGNEVAATASLSPAYDPRNLRLKQ